MANDFLEQQKNNNGFQGAERNIDRISNLPDSLIQHILSFLPTKYVVPTLVLSKRWKSLWIGVPSLDFEESRYTYASYDRFRNFVEKVLLLRDGSTIQRFRLSLSYTSTYYSFKYYSFPFLIRVAISHEVQQLDITLCDFDQFYLPCSIFDCQTLSILKLSMKCTLDLPSRISLPCLKVLHLCSFAFPNAESIEKLFSCCPVLEELTLLKCRLIHQNSVNISIPSLKSLTMDDSFEKYDLPKSGCYIKLEAPSLQSFNYNGTLTNQLYLPKMSSIHKFRLSLSYDIPSINSGVQSAIAGAINHKLQMLDIYLCVERPFPLPCSIFDCQSLSILKLSMVNFTLELPDYISLPRLKVMHLRYLAFQNAKYTEKMFSCCPVLEELALQECKWMNQDSITISIPSLKILTFCDSSTKYNNSCYITIEAPALLSFNYTGCLTNQLYLTNMSSIKACIHITAHCFYGEDSVLRLVKLLQDLKNVVSLTISNETAEVLTMVRPVSDHLSVFHHLEYLELSTKVEDRVFKWLLKFFDFMPNLGTIQFSKGVGYTINRAGLWHMPKPLLPKCFSSSLKIFGLGNFSGQYHEIFFLKSFLERAVSLKRVNICRNKHDQLLFKDEMEKLPMRFKHCEIIVR